MATVTNGGGSVTIDEVHNWLQELTLTGTVQSHGLDKLTLVIPGYILL